MTTTATADSETGSATPILRVRGATKTFGAVRALSGVDLEIHAGEVVALVGDNGAGKSTLVKSMVGVGPADSGTIEWDGKPVHITGPKAAQAIGIATVFQDLALCDNLDLVANLFLGREEIRRGSLDEIKMESKARELLSELSVTTIQDLRSPVGLLSGGQRQSVAIARSLLGEPRVVILDEPTAALGVAQTAEVLALVKRLRERGFGVLLISHNLADVFEVADRIVVLRLGRNAGDFKTVETDQQAIVTAITGADAAARAEEEAAAPPKPTAETEGRSWRQAARDRLRAVPGRVGRAVAAPFLAVGRGLARVPPALREIPPALAGAPSAIGRGIGSVREVPGLLARIPGGIAALPGETRDFVVNLPNLTRQGFRDFRLRVRAGELGSIPVVLGLVVIWIVFQAQNSSFLSSENLSNLATQMAATGTIALGIVLVLLLGEIDLSVGSVSGVTSAILAVMNVNHGWAPIPAILLACAAGVTIGLIQGLFLSRLGVPSFVVTLAGLIGWSGLQLAVLGSEGTINLPYSGGIAKLANTYYTSGIGFTIAIGVTVVYGLFALFGRRRRVRAGLEAISVRAVLLRTLALGALLVVVVAVMDGYRGLPLALVIFGGLTVIFDLILRHARAGRKIFAVGGNAEAARRAGISVPRVQLGVMMACSLMAAAGGVLAASRLYAVNQSSGASDVLLNAIAAAVIGGTSLFGGRGTAYSALLGILVIQSIANGMLLLSLGTDVRYMITGVVLLAAVTIDALARRGQASRGLA